jgi:serine/threonine protein kinase
VHCDVKPSNILITTPGLQSPEGSVVKIVDFGIARHLGEERTEGAAGTVAYMAPERTRGEAPDVRTDLWSMGVVLYEMLTGRLPFRPERNLNMVDAVRHQEPEPVENLRPDVPPALDQIIRRCLRKDPAQRYADVGAMLADLDRLEHLRTPGSRPRRSGRDRGPATPGDRLAVLPLDNLSREPGHDYFAVGMTQELIARLSKLSGLRVIGLAASTRYAGSGKRIAEIGLELGVSAVLTGSLLRDGAAFRIGVELIDAVNEVSGG